MNITKKQWWYSSKVNNDEIPLGTIYDQSSWNNLNDFVQNGGTYSVNGSNQITLSGTGLTQTLDYNRISRLEKWTITIRFIVQSGEGGGFIGMRSRSTFAKWNFMASWASDALSVQTGLEDGMVTQGSTVSCAGSVGDVMELSLSKDGPTMTATCQNITTAGALQTKTYTHTTSSVTSPLICNTGRFCFGSYSSGMIITSINITSTVVKNSKVCFLVDSIGEGYCPDVYDLGYVRIHNSQFPSSIIVGGQNDTLAEGVALIPEIQQLNPEIVVIAQGINDIGYGVSSATYLANYDSIVSQLQALGKRVVHMKYYSTAYDVSPLWNHITSTYSSDDYIDTSTGLTASDILADGVHLNRSGNAKFAANIITSGKLKQQVSSAPLSLNPLAWYNNGSTYMLSDGSIWYDTMGGNSANATGTARPTYTLAAQNSLDSFTFDGTTDVLSAPKITTIQNVSGLTFWSVGKRYCLAHDAASSGNRSCLLHFTNDTIFAILSTVSDAYGTFAFSNDFNYAIMVFDGSLSGNANRLKLWVNGVQRTLSFTGTIPATTESDASSVLKIGRTNADFIAGQTLEAGIVNRAITGAEVTSLNSYLSSKYLI